MRSRRLWRLLMLGAPPPGDGVRGFATVLAASRKPHPTPRYVGGAKFHLVVELPNEPPYKLRLKCSAPGEKYPQPGQRIPVIVARNERERLWVDWESIPSPDDHFAALDLPTHPS